MKQIRKISIGSNYKEGAIHYSIGQQVYGGHQISEIIKQETGYDIIIRKDSVDKIWKTFNNYMAIALEYRLDLQDQ